MPPATTKPITAAAPSVQGEVSAFSAARPLWRATASTRWRRSATSFSPSSISASGGIIAAQSLGRFRLASAQLAQERGERQLLRELQREPAERAGGDQVDQRRDAERRS